MQQSANKDKVFIRTDVVPIDPTVKYLGIKIKY